MRITSNFNFVSVAAISLLAATPAFADLKCGDGKQSVPFQFRPNELATTWAGPVPQGAKVKIVGGDVFSNVSRQLGPDTPQGFPDKYTKGLNEVEIFNATLSFNLQQFIDVERHYGFTIDKRDDALPIFEKYEKLHNDFITVLVQQPSESTSAKTMSRCSVVLQRGIIEYADGQETLFLRSYFHSANDKGEAANFVPQGGLEITFPSEEIWFPLSLTKVIDEPASYVVLDILTTKATKPLNASELDKSFHVEGEKKEIDFQGQKLDAMRVSAKIESGKDIEDFRVNLK